MVNLICVNLFMLTLFLRTCLATYLVFYFGEDDPIALLLISILISNINDEWLSKRPLACLFSLPILLPFLIYPAKHKYSNSSLKCRPDFVHLRLHLFLRHSSSALIKPLFSIISSSSRRLIYRHNHRYLLLTSVWFNINPSLENRPKSYFPI